MAFAAGPAGVLRRERLLRMFTELFVRRIPASERPSELVAQAITGAIWVILHRHISNGNGRLLPALADHISYIALAPVIGAWSL